MGYTLSNAAGKTLDRIQEATKKAGIATTNALSSGKGFYELVRNTQSDYGACGTVYCTIGESTADESHQCWNAGSFTIDGDGQIISFPGLPKKDWPKYNEPRRVYAS